MTPLRCRLGRHDVERKQIAGFGELLIVPTCRRPGCDYIDVAGVETHAWNRKTKRAARKRIARRLTR